MSSEPVNTKMRLRIVLRDRKVDQEQKDKEPEHIDELQDGQFLGFSVEYLAQTSLAAHCTFEPFAETITQRANPKTVMLAFTQVLRENSFIQHSDFDLLLEPMAKLLFRDPPLPDDLVPCAQECLTLVIAGLESLEWFTIDDRFLLLPRLVKGLKSMSVAMHNAIKTIYASTLQNAAFYEKIAAKLASSNANDRILAADFISDIIPWVSITSDNILSIFMALVSADLTNMFAAHQHDANSEARKAIFTASENVKELMRLLYVGLNNRFNTQTVYIS